MNPQGSATSSNPQVMLRICQIIALGLSVGYFFFGGALFVVAGLNPPKAPPPNAEALPFNFAMGGFILALVHCCVSIFIYSALLSPEQLKKRMEKKNEQLETAVLKQFQIATIVAYAICETGGMGSAIFTCVANMASQPIWPWAASLVFPLVLMAMHFPTREKLDRWLELAKRSK